MAAPALHAAESKEGVNPMAEALQTGATVAQIFLGYLEPNATPEFPGTQAWLKGSGATLTALVKDKPSDAWRSLDPDKLITRNAAYWQSFYEVSPADPGLVLLHGGTLLCAGDPQRALLALRLVLHRGDLDESSVKIITSVMQHAGAFMEPSHTLVREGVALHDKGDFAGAIAKFDEALKIWPRNGWALYEKGFSIRIRETGGKQEPPAAVTAFARSREVDPFQWSAWQGTVKDIPGLMEMQQVARPLWEKSLGDIGYVMTDAELTQFADTLQLAQVDDLALLARQVLVHRRGRYTPEDHPFISKSLRRLVPGERTEATIAKLAGPSFKAIRIYESQEKTAQEQP